MSIYSRMAPRKFTQTKNLGKAPNSGMVFSLINKKDTTAQKVYFNNPISFLSTSTVGSTISGYDVSNDLIANAEYTPTYLGNVNKATQIDYTVPYNLAPIANAQIDTAILVDVSVNNVIRVVFKSNYAGATATLRLSSDALFTNTISWNITGTSTLANGVYTTVANLKVGVGSVLVGVPVLTALTRQRFIGVNQTAVNRIAPVSVYYAPNYQSIPGSVINFKACCVDEPLLKRELDTAELMCGQSVNGETATKDSFTLSFSMMEESPDFMALSMGSIASIQKEYVFEHLPGFVPGSNTPIVADVVALPTRGQLNIGSGLLLQTVVTSDCANLQYVDYNTSMLTTQDAGLDNGQYSYDTVAGLLYFNAGNIGKTLEITIFVQKDIIMTTPAPLRLGHICSVMIQDVNAENSSKYTFIKKFQFKMPEESIEDEGTKLDFEGTAFFSKIGDVKRGYSV